MTVWKVADVAQFLGVPETSVYKYAKEGLIPAMKIGKHWMFDKEAIEAKIANHNHKGGESHVRRKSKRGRSRQ